MIAAVVTLSYPELGVFGLICIGIGWLTATVGLWTAGMFAVGTRADDNTDYPWEGEEWDFPPFSERIYDQDNDAA